MCRQEGCGTSSAILFLVTDERTLPMTVLIGSAVGWEVVEGFRNMRHALSQAGPTALCS